MTYLANQTTKPSPSGRGLGEGLARSQTILRTLRDMNSHSEFISRKLLQDKKVTR